MQQVVGFFIHKKNMHVLSTAKIYQEKMHILYMIFFFLLFC